MLIQENLTPEQLKELQGSNSSYIVLDTKHILTDIESIKFKTSIEFLNFINTVSLCNSLYKSFDLDVCIDTEILFTAFNSFLNNKQFNNVQLEQYFKTKLQFNSFVVSIENFQFIDSYPPYVIEYVLLGLDYKVYNSMSAAGAVDGLHEKYGDLLSAFEFDGMKIEEFIIKTKTLIKNYNISE